jgi:predicted NUDIX family NTP pyrophosphohydrolase
MMMPSMAARSAGLLQYRISDDGVLEVLLVHPGGPFWARKDDGSWSLPKGEYGADEDPRAAAAREFEEETGLRAAASGGIALGEVRQPGGKQVVAWAVEGDLDVSGASSNTFELEWPHGSGRVQTFPEVDRVEWMSVRRARTKLLKGQLPFLDRLLAVATEAGGASVTEGPNP